MRPLRVVITSPRSARSEIALTAAIAELHGTGKIPDTLRIYSYPKAVLLGRNQDLHPFVNVDACESRGVEIARRVTGGGAIYVDRGVITFDLVAGAKHLNGSIDNATRKCGGIVASALARFGLPAEYRRPNSVEIAGQKVCGMSGFFDGPTFVCQGSILVEADLASMTACLKPLGARPHNIANLSALLGRTLPSDHLIESLATLFAVGLDCCAERESLTASESELANELFEDELGTDVFVGLSSMDSTTVPVALFGESRP